jgi:hypothetical protein
MNRAEKKVAYILNVTRSIVGIRTLERFRKAPPENPRVFFNLLSRQIELQILGMSGKALGRISSYALGQERCWELEQETFIENATLEDVGFSLRNGLSGLEILRAIAAATIICVAWDILHQEELKAEHKRFEKTRRSYPLA